MGIHAKQDTKKELALLAKRLKDNLHDFKRPLIIEFSGTPKSGKTTCVDAVAKFFRRQDIPVFLVTERASICPLNDKHHLHFNAWTGMTSLAQMFEALERKVGVAILDRGLFDALVWMDFLKNRQAITEADLRVVENFLLLERWKKYIDIVVAVSVSPSTALEREFKDQITDIQGSIMNEPTLNQYNSSLAYCITKYGNRFNKILHIDTTNKETIEGVSEIAFAVLSAADNLVDEDIAVVDRSIIEKGMPSTGIMTNKEDVFRFMGILNSKVRWLKRSIAEGDSSLVQMIPAATIRSNHEIVVMVIRDKRGSRLANRLSIWAGGHARKSDMPKNSTKFGLFRNCLVRELEEELHIQLNYSNLPSLPKALIWDRTVARSAQHLGVIFEYELPGNTPREVLHQREIWETPHKSLFTEFKEFDENIAKTQGWERWSALYLSEIYNITVNSESSPVQSALF